MKDDIDDILADGQDLAVRLLVQRVKDGEASSSDMRLLRDFAKDAGVTLTFSGKTTPLGDSILESMSDLDPELFN